MSESLPYTTLPRKVWNLVQDLAQAFLEISEGGASGLFFSPESWLTGKMLGYKNLKRRGFHLGFDSE